jgi:hypothetical protein
MSSTNGLCNCIGPQNGQPLCPCKMSRVIERNGRYIIPEQDLGPVVKQVPSTISDGVYRQVNPENEVCMHSKCESCHGTGRRSDGTGCIHMISCPCSKCNPVYL